MPAESLQLYHPMSLQSVGAGVTGHAVNTSDYAGSSRHLLGSMPERASHQYSGASGLDFGTAGGRLGMGYGGGSGGHSHHSGGGSSPYLSMSAPASLSANHSFGSHSLNGAGAGGGGAGGHHGSALYSSSHHHSQQAHAPPPLHQPHHPSQPQHPHHQPHPSSLPPAYLPNPSQGSDSRLASVDPGPHAHGYYGES